MVSRPERPELPATEAEMRLGLASQSRVARALHEYADAMVVAFGKMSELQQALQTGGLDWIDDAMPLSRALLAGIGEAHKVVKGVRDDKRVSLETHRRTLAACEADLAAADAAGEELQRYSNKLDRLSTEEVRKGNNQRAVAGLARNREKMRSAANASSVKHTRAFDALQACASRADDLCLLACDVLAGTAAALRSAAAHVGGEAPSPDGAAQHDEAPCSAAHLAAPSTPAPPVPLSVAPRRRAAQCGEASALAPAAEEDATYSPFYEGACASAPPPADGAQASVAEEGACVPPPPLADGPRGCQGHHGTGGWSSATTECSGAAEASAAQTASLVSSDDCDSLVVSSDECGSVGEVPRSPSAPWARRAVDLGPREAPHAQGDLFVQRSTSGEGALSRAERNRAAPHAERARAAARSLPSGVAPGQARRPPFLGAPAPPMPQKPELPGMHDPFDFDALDACQPLRPLF